MLLGMSTGAKTRPLNNSLWYNLSKQASDRLTFIQAVVPAWQVSIYGMLPIQTSTSVVAAILAAVLPPITEIESGTSRAKSTIANSLS